MPNVLEARSRRCNVPLARFPLQVAIHARPTFLYFPVIVSKVTDMGGNE
jgi:hypothetical protein